MNQVRDPLQQEGGISRGEDPRMPCCCFIRQDDLTDGTVIVLVDFVNAFNRVNRNHMLDEVMIRVLPRIYAWAQYTYASRVN